VVLEIIPQKPPDIRVDINGEQTAITAQVFLEADIISIQSGEDYEDPGRITMINEALERRLNGELMRIIQRCQREFRSDIFGFGNYARWRVYTWDELLALNWHERFPEARVDVAVEVEVRRVGLLRKTYWEHQVVSFLTSNKAGNLHKTFGVMDTSEITWAKDRPAGNKLLRSQESE
jgi:spore germination protein KC